MISIGKILFFILMPIFYKALEILISQDRYKHYFLWQGVQLVYYYGIEAIYILLHYSVTKEWIFMKNLVYPNSYFVFVVLSIIFILASLVCLCDSELEDDIIFYDVVKTFVLSVLFAVFMILAMSITKCSKNEMIFNNMPYKKTEEKVISLRAFSDTHTTSGKIHGGLCYINGNIQDNYELYYSFLAEDGSLTIRHFTYTEAHCKIFPEENCENPRLEIITYAKSYENNYDSYEEYILHIPDDSIIGTGIDFE